MFTGNECLQSSYASDVSDLSKKVEADECISINKMKSLRDKRPFMARPYGCAICNELFEKEQGFLEHCSNHGHTPPDELFIDL